jgi:hypothetical protein
MNNGDAPQQDFRERITVGKFRNFTPAQAI